MQIRSHAAHSLDEVAQHIEIDLLLQVLNVLIEPPSFPELIDGLKLELGQVFLPGQGIDPLPMDAGELAVVDIFHRVIGRCLTRLVAELFSHACERRQFRACDI